MILDQSEFDCENKYIVQEKSLAKDSVQVPGSSSLLLVYVGVHNFYYPRPCCLHFVWLTQINNVFI